MTQQVLYPGGRIELRQDEEDVLLPRLQSSVFKAPIVQLVPQGEKGWEGGRCEPCCDVGTTHVHLFLLPRISLPLTDVFQQLRDRETKVLTEAQ